MRYCALLAVSVLVVCPSQLASASPEPIQQALARLYNFDFPAAHRILDDYIAEQPKDPVGYAFRGAAHLFHELDRLLILESEFFADDKKIADKKKLVPDPRVRAEFYKAVLKAEQLANERLLADPDNRMALFALCLKDGLVTDYEALVEKKQLRSLSHARRSNTHAVRLLNVQPDFYDAYLTTGINEYLMGSLPFFIRWFVRIDQVDGSKDVAIRNLELVARSGKYLGPFAKILLAIICLREKMPEKSLALLRDLSLQYPENPLIRKELAKVTAKLQSGELR